jgi:putative addiction module killer protein
MQVLEYLDADGNRPFRLWFDDLDAQAAAKVTTALARLEQGNLSNVKSVGGGVQEYRIDLGRDGDTLIILLGGGTKKRQGQDIATAQARWTDYKRRK